MKKGSRERLERIADANARTVMELAYEQMRELSVGALPGDQFTIMQVAASCGPKTGVEFDIAMRRWVERCYGLPLTSAAPPGAWQSPWNKGVIIRQYSIADYKITLRMWSIDTAPEGVIKINGHLVLWGEWSLTTKGG